MPARRFAHACRASSAALTTISVLVLLGLVGLLVGLGVLGAGSAAAASGDAGQAAAPAPSLQASTSVAGSGTASPSPQPSTQSGTSSGPTTTRRLRMPDHRLVTRGLPTRVRARFTRAGHPRRGVRVRFYRRAWGHRVWHYVGHARTNRRGWASIPWTVHRSAQWRARVPAHDGRRAVPSNVLRARARSLGASAVRVAATRRGDPYSWGADGPHRFDCSGLTRWVFHRLGHALPHNSAAQYGRVRHIARDHKRVGDLIFFHDGGGHIYHVAIYAGDGKMWHAPHSGTRVREQRIYSRSYFVGRV